MGLDFSSDIIIASFYIADEKNFKYILSYAYLYHYIFTTIFCFLSKFFQKLNEKWHKE